MPPDEVNEEMQEPSAPTDDKPAQAAKPDTVTISRAELESLHRQRDEARDSERAWANIATRGRAPEPQPQAGEPAEQFDGSPFMDPNAPDGIEGDTPEKLVDEFAAKGVSALKARGFITAADAQKLAVKVAADVSREMISRERQKMSADTQITREFPELLDNTSELYKATAIRYQRAIAMDPRLSTTPSALYLAAEAARESLKAKAPARRNGDDDYEPEGDRRRRAESQDSRPRGRGVMEDPDDYLGPEAKQIIQQFGITEKEFRESKKASGDQRPRNFRR